MAMTGIVRYINAQRGMVAIETDGHGYTIIELLDGDEIEVGDKMWWADDTACGGEDYKNITKGTVMSVYVQNHWVAPEQLRQQLLIG